MGPAFQFHRRSGVPLIFGAIAATTAFLDWKEKPSSRTKSNILRPDPRPSRTIEVIRSEDVCEREADRAIL
jgi:hypothetical protein